MCWAQELQTQVSCVRKGWDIELTRLWKKSSDQKYRFHTAGVLACGPAYKRKLFSSPNPGFTQGQLLMLLSDVMSLSYHYFWMSKYTQTAPSPVHSRYFWLTMHSIYRSADRDKFTHQVHPVHLAFSLRLYLSSDSQILQIVAKSLQIVLQGWETGG